MGLVVKPQKRQRYSRAFKQQTLALVNEQGLTPAEAAIKQGIREANIYRWRREFESGGDSHRQQQDLDELQRLRRENTQLKKALKSLRQQLDKG
ncbi:transposase [Gilvimarinus algae]|uniref:Transposase n=1 Tax=Gilvimarinus algae TaxID=3058037 RepID=A0ABT8TE04_9GAMM|nr:transposase [Gilvimarinus sp. SDUM040014]MDO3382351.1 transposase [Gilvimarinus sp. SDUM040014]